MQISKPKNTTRLYTQNTNGFKLTTDVGGTFLTAAQQLRRMKVDIAGFSEINLDTTKPRVQEKLHTASRLTTDHYRLQTSSSQVKAKFEYKPGGTLTLLRNNVTSRLARKGSDPLGRWSYVTLNCKGTGKITFITAYQVGTSRPKPDGKMTAATQQYSQLLDMQREEAEQVRKHFVSDLQKFISQCKKNNERCIVQGKSLVFRMIMFQNWQCAEKND